MGKDGHKNMCLLCSLKSFARKEDISGFEEKGWGWERSFYFSSSIAASLSVSYFHNEMLINKNYFRNRVETRSSLEMGRIFPSWRVGASAENLQQIPHLEVK